MIARLVRTARQLRTGRCHGDDGAVLVEAAMVLPLLATLLLGAFEFGMGWRQASYQNASVAAGVRQLATNGATRWADKYALQSFQAGMASTKNMTVRRVIIFKSTSTGTPSTACLNKAVATGQNGAGVADECNVYGPDQLANLNNTNYFGTESATSCTGNADQWWCPVGTALTKRKDSQGGPPDFVGMYVESDYQTFTRIVGTNIRLTDKASMQIEPRVS